MGQWCDYECQTRPIPLVSVRSAVEVSGTNLSHHRSVHGQQSSRGQPDGGLSETCIAALNIDFYPDGAKLHDVGCEHRKPVLCE